MQREEQKTWEAWERGYGMWSDTPEDNQTSIEYAKAWSQPQNLITVHCNKSHKIYCALNPYYK